MRHLLEIDDLSTVRCSCRILDLATSADTPRVLAGKGAALIFEKPSARTRNSMEMAVVQLGGHPVYIQGHEVGFDTRETVEDVTRTMACFHSIVGGAGLRPFGGRTNGRARSRPDRQHVERRRPSAAGARRLC